MRKEKLVRVGIDTGGTFTDFVVAYGSRTTHFKVPSTPRNPAEAILAGVTRVINTLGLVPSDLVHGTTVATNALLERKGARTALITTEGFEDVIEIGRQARPEIYNLMVTRPSPLVPPELRFGVRERTGPAGEILERLDPESVAEIVKAIKASRDTDQAVQSVAVCLLFSFANAAHEQAIATAVASLRVPVSLSHEILPEYREYERTSTVVINAYLVPLMSRYLEFLTSGLSTLASADPDRNSPPRGSRGASRDEKVYSLRVMQSNGGSVSATTAAREPVRAILSGPAGGVVGALRVAAAAGIKDIITFDMGGTSTDVALCRGEARTTNEALVAGLPVAVPVIDIHTVGAGGGSIARVDEAGALRVGPESAGADPGPACYGKGDLPTVTDANLILGRFGRPALLGGEMMLDYSRARKAVSRLAEQMSRASGDRFTPERAALGVIRVANANMEAALRVVSVERGQDPRLFSLVCFGGAGGLHACELANGLRIPRIIVPRSPGTLSALGVLLGDVVKDYSRTVMLPASQADSQQTERLFAELEARAGRDLKNEGFDKARIRFSRAAALRYVGQSFEID
ncbi:MAG TPA: hydantoinase/oxoprolinase family protein, partial [Blastocatellia bacterium]|nr:hydantoinase/oxoprolinase family protein [Blastocatellia bacterium]